MEREHVSPDPDRSAARTVWIPERPARPFEGPPRIRLIGTGAALPSRDLPGGVLDNDTLAKLSQEAVARMREADSPDDWRPSDADFPLQRIGVERRHVLDSCCDVGDLACSAAEEGLRRLGAKPGDAFCKRIGLVIVASVSAEDVVPVASTRVVGRLGAGPRVQAFDLVLGCNGFTAALDMANRWLDSAASGCVAVVIGSEVMSRLIHAADRTTAPIFGDAAAALFLERQRVGSSTDSVDAYTDPEGGPRIRITPLAVHRGPVLRFAHDNGEWFLREDKSHRSTVVMDGRRVFRDMVRRLPEAMNAALQRRRLSWGDIELVLFHQANLRLLQAVAESLELSPERFPTNIARVGNTTSASIPLLLHEIDQEGRLRSGQRLLLVGFGTGYSIGVTTLLWP